MRKSFVSVAIMTELSDGEAMIDGEIIVLSSEDEDDSTPCCLVNY